MISLVGSCSFGADQKHSSAARECSSKGVKIGPSTRSASASLQSAPSGAPTLGTKPVVVRAHAPCLKPRYLVPCQSIAQNKSRRILQPRDTNTRSESRSSAAHKQRNKSSASRNLELNRPPPRNATSRYRNIEHKSAVAGHTREEDGWLHARHHGFNNAKRCRLFAPRFKVTSFFCFRRDEEGDNEES